MVAFPNRLIGYKRHLLTPLEIPPVETGKPPASTGAAGAGYIPPAPARIRGKLFMLPKEPEDAQITGGTRSLDRRLLALNLPGTRPTLAR